MYIWEREALTKWLRKQADLVERKGWNFAPQFRARLMKDGNATREGEEVV